MLQQLGTAGLHRDLNSTYSAFLGMLHEIAAVVGAAVGVGVGCAP